LLCRKCKEQKTTGALAVQESQTGLEDLRLSKKNIYCLPVSHTVALDICVLFPERQPSICKNLNQKRWRPWNQALTDSQILGVMSNEGRGLYRGCHFGRETRHGVIDIDINSKYHNAQELAKIRTRFAAVGLELTPYQSSESGGWHLYFFFSSFVLSQEVETVIKRWLKVQGYELAGGTLEVFPSGNALRLPLQKGFGWLDSDGKLVKRREEITTDEAISSFLSDLTKTQANWDEVRSLIESQISETRAAAGRSGQEHRERVSADGLEELYTRGLDHETYQRGRNYWLNGLTGASQRHSAILSVGHYLWFGDTSQGVRALPGVRNAGARVEAISHWLREKHNGHSETINSDRWRDVQSDIENACYWTPKGSLVSESESYPLTDRLINRLCQTKVLTPDQYAKANRRREGAARAKIRAALNQMLAEGKHPTIRNLVQATGCRKETVKKHSDIWAIYATRTETRMSTGLGDLSGGLGGISFAPVLFSGSSFEFESSDQPSSGISHKNTKTTPKLLGISGSDSFALLDGSRPEEVELIRQAYSYWESFDLSSICSGSTGSKTSSDLDLPGVLDKDVQNEKEDLEPSVAPFAHAWQTSQPESTLSQAQVLRMPAASLTKGPRLSGNQALRHGQAGGLFSISPVCYSSGITGGIGERGQATAETGSLSYLPREDLKISTVSDAINSTFLATIINGSDTGLEDKILEPISNLRNAKRLKTQAGQGLKLDLSSSSYSRFNFVYTRYMGDTSCNSSPHLPKGGAILKMCGAVDTRYMGKMLKCAAPGVKQALSVDSS
jgi:hypothetical protein